MISAAASSANPVCPFLSGVEQMRIGIPSALLEEHSKSPTASASKYVDIFGVVSNVTVCLPGVELGVSDTTAPFEMAWSPVSIVALSANAALKAGSSNDGNMRRASV